MYEGATALMDLCICEPALGSGAFLNDATSKLSAEYLECHKAALGETLEPTTQTMPLNQCPP